MEWQSSWTDPFQQYLKPFASLIGDRRTWQALLETVKGIIASGSVIGHRIASSSPELSRSKDGGQRVLRMAKGESTRRSEIDAEHLTAQLRQVGIAQLRQSEEEEVWLIADGSDLCKPYAQEMPYLMEVLDEHERLVPGYRTLTVIGVTPNRRGILYQKVLSSKEPGFMSEPAEVQTMLSTVSTALAELTPSKEVTWLLDSGFDDVAVWRTIWEQEEHVVCRVSHRDRIVQWQTESGKWASGTLKKAAERRKLLAEVRTRMEVQRGKQAHPKKQAVEVEISACPFQIAYHSEMRRPSQGKDQILHKGLWLVQVRVLDTTLEPWWLLTDWPVETEAEALHIFCMYRQRWAIEDSFKFTKTCLGWEAVQVLDWRAIKTLVALAWVAAGFLYEMGVTFSWEEVQLLAKLGGWVPHKGRFPGKIVLFRGLARLLDMLTTQAVLSRYVSEYGNLPPKIAAFLHGLSPPGEL
jgi:Transposase DDE domain